MDKKYLIGVGAVIIVTILAIILILRRSPDTTSDVPQTVRQEQLEQLAGTGSQASFTTVGEIVAAEEHHSVVITVSANQRVIEVFRGYDRNTIKRETYPNTQTAYNTFIQALEAANFNEAQDYEVDDPTGVCPLGKRYLYQIRERGTFVVDLWNTSCSREQGTFDGNASLTRTLFREQIPNYNDIVRGVNL